MTLRGSRFSNPSPCPYRMPRTTEASVLPAGVLDALLARANASIHLACCINRGQVRLEASWRLRSVDITQACRYSSFAVNPPEVVIRTWERLLPRQMRRSLSFFGIYRLSRRSTLIQPAPLAASARKAPAIAMFFMNMIIWIWSAKLV